MSTRYAIDWQTLLEELRLSGLTFRQLAQETDVSHVTLVKYANQDTSPLHANGERLIAVWISRTGKQRAELPLTHVVKRVTRLSA